MAHSTRITLKDIAARLGISHTTVSLALKDHHRISKPRRQEIQQMAKKMGYVPDPFLSGLAAYRRKNARVDFQGTMAWIRHWKQPDLRSKLQYHGELWAGACQAAKRFGYRVEECCWEEGFSAKRFAQILLSRGIQGLLIPPHFVPFHQSFTEWHDFDWSKFSIIRFGLSVPFPDSNLVTPDAFRATVMAINKIQEYGYKRIGFVVGDYDGSRGGNFSGGFMLAQWQLKLSPAIPPLVTSGDRYRVNADQENKNLKRWLERHRPDAILTTEGQLPKQLRSLGVRIPQDIALAAADIHDVEADAGIDQHAEAVGQIAVEMLVKQINVSERGEPENPSRILVESRWQDGKSLPRRRAV